jgi:hypothetical protein
MFINQIDQVIDDLLNNFNNYINNIDNIDDIILNKNFYKYQKNIIDIIKNFIENIDKTIITNIIKDKYYNNFINIIKKYCLLYIYLKIAYYYEDDAMYIKNIINCSNIETEYDINNFFNSYNNSQIIYYFNNIKYILSLLELKSIDKIKIILLNDIIKYETIINIFNELGEEYINNYFLVENNTFNIIKTIIFKFIYLKDDKDKLLTILQNNEQENIEYEYIDIIVSNNNKIVEFGHIEYFLHLNKLPMKLANEMYEYIYNYIHIKDNLLVESNNYINYLFKNKIIIPITEDFLRYHKDSEKYINITKNIDNESINIRDSTQIKYIIYKINNIYNYYSSLITPKLKLEIKNLFYKQYENRLAVLYNNNLEIKIINKLEKSEQATDYDLLIDLINLRKYTYLNFKDFSKDGISFYTSEPVSCLRYTNITDKNKRLIETRITNENINVNIIGIALNISNNSIDLLYNNNLINIRKNNENAFDNFLKKLNLRKKHNKIYYWLFENKYDKPKTSLYINYNINDVQNNIKLILNEIYLYYLKILNNKIIKMIKLYNSNFNLYHLNNFLSKYRNILGLYPNIKNNIIEYSYYNKIKHINIFDEHYFDEQKKKYILKLPEIEIKNKEKLINIINKELYIIDKQICYHNIKWRNILQLSKNTDDYSQEIFNFAKQYLRINNEGLYICKSCNELLKIDKYVVTGTYVEELDVFLTTNIGVNKNLEETLEYSKFTRTIKNIDKIIEKIALFTSNIIYIGNYPIIKLRRRMMIKDILDFILIHSSNNIKFKKKSIDEYYNKYGINKDLTQLYFFEFKDDLFSIKITSYDNNNIIKYNNIIVYIIFFIILDLNIGQILYLKNHKIFNYLLFEKTYNVLFDNLYILLNSKEKINLNKLPLLSYIIFYFSGILVYNKLWLYNENKTDKKINYIIILQRIIIHTFIDFINNVINTALNNKNYMYINIYNKLKIKITTLFNNINLFNQLNKNSKLYDKNIDIDYIDINKINNEYIYEYKEYCFPIIYYKFKNKYDDNINIFDKFTNCNDGEFHNWIYQSNKLLCSKCNILYEALSESQNHIFNNKTVNINYLRKLSKIYCVKNEGNIHEYNNSIICIHCNKDINSHIFNDTDLYNLSNLIEKNKSKNILNYIDKINNNEKKYELINNKNNNFLDNFNKILSNNDIHNFNNFKLYINNFINNLINLLSNKINLNNYIFYLNQTYITINHNSYGKKIEPFDIPFSKFIIDENNKIFNKDIIYYKDKHNNVYVYYDLITLQYLGYSEIYNINIIYMKSYATLIIKHSLIDYIILLGSENEYINLFYLDRNYNNDSNLNELILKYIRNRVSNLKQIIIKIKTIIYCIINKNIPNNNINTYNIISESINNIHNINILNKNQMFNNTDSIINNLNINYNINMNIDINNNYINIKYINELFNIDIKMIFYIIYNLNSLLEDNNNHDMALLIIKIIKFVFELYYKSYSNINIRMFEHLLINDPPYINDTYNVTGIYNELITNIDETNIKNREDEAYESEQVIESLDIDDYEVDDEFDERIENIGE